jgi:hypothetical protein
LPHALVVTLEPVVGARQLGDIGRWAEPFVGHAPCILSVEVIFASTSFDAAWRLMM